MWSHSPYCAVTPFHTAVRVDFYYLTIELIWMWQRIEKSLSVLPMECWKGYRRSVSDTPLTNSKMALLGTIKKPRNCFSLFCRYLQWGRVNDGKYYDSQWLVFLYECTEGNKKCHYHNTAHWKIIFERLKKSVDIFQLAALLLMEIFSFLVSSKLSYGSYKSLTHS